ncbi:hypothetical protein BKA64DRAFT_647467 [Cadophora sp. MPI-SDFR-AT-0126]|nr:hypothetical protein BKA64DRAFT_647467 [Leotiomycetes sp. MPI-SDFR-AT-0126]
MFSHAHIPKFVTLWHLLLSITTAQSPSHSKSQSHSAITTSLIFANWDGHVSVVAVDTRATTYLDDNHDPSRNNSNTIDCNAEAYDRITLVNGPSTAGVTVIYTECGTNLATSYRYDCPLTEPNTATCTYVFSVGNSTGTSMETMNSSEMSPQPCTIIAGIEKLSPGSVTASTTSGGSALVPQTTVPSLASSTASAQILPSSTSGAGSCFMVSYIKVFLAATVVGISGGSLM